LREFITFNGYQEFFRLSETGSVARPRTNVASPKPAFGLQALFDAVLAPDELLADAGTAIDLDVEALEAGGVPGVLVPCLVRPRLRRAM